MYYLKSVEDDMYNIVDTRDSSESLVSLEDLYAVYHNSYKTRILGLRYSLGEISRVYPFILFSMVDSCVLTDGYCIFILENENEQWDYATDRYAVDYADSYPDATFKELFYLLREINTTKYRARSFNVNSFIGVKGFDKSDNTIIGSDNFCYNIFNIIYSYVYENVGVEGITSISYDEVHWENGEVWKVADELDILSKDAIKASTSLLRYQSTGVANEYKAITCESTCMEDLFKDNVAIWVDGVPCYNFLDCYDENSDVVDTPLFESLETYNINRIKPMDLEVSKTANWHSLIRQFGLSKGVNLSALKMLYPEELVGKLNDMASRIIKMELVGTGIFPSPTLNSNHISSNVYTFKDETRSNKELSVGAIATTESYRDDVLCGNTTYVTDYGSIITKEYYSESLGCMRYSRSGMIIFNSRTKKIEHVPVLKDCNVFNYPDSDFCKNLSTIVSNLSYSDELLLPLGITFVYPHKKDSNSLVEIRVMCLVKPLLSGKRLTLYEPWETYYFSVIEVPLLLSGIRWKYDKWGRVCFRTLLQHVSMDARILNHLSVENYTGLSQSLFIDFYRKSKVRDNKSVEFYTEEITRVNKKIFSAYHDLAI